ncbi:MAG TPA: amidohydrolase family protein [Candidatus Binataceae bacterium]|jgi:predicted TIM-barrel fold metal-dependent hydrolase|nr:amidohydrolase family protein [Candidatus Binataceae bacterium]
MTLRFGVISVDDHVVEPPDLWTRSMSRAKWGDRLPHLAVQPDRTERWVIDGQVSTLASPAPVGALSDDRGAEPQTWSQVPGSAYEPKARLAAMDADGIDCSVLYPSAAGVSGEAISAIKDLELQIECARVYNDWIIDVWTATSPRFVPQAILPTGSVEAATAEARRAVSRGHKGVIMPAQPSQVNPASPHLYKSEWDALWVTLQELDVPVCFHAGSAPSVMFEISPAYDTAGARAFDNVRQAAGSAALINGMVLSGILYRFPRLQPVFAGSAIDYVPFGLEALDHQWERQRLAENEGFAERPSAIFRRQCYVTTWKEKVGLRNRKYIGVDRILWQSEFPRASSTYPETARMIDHNFAEVPQPDRDAILWRNAARLYKLTI